MKNTKDLINWVALSKHLANNETSVSRKRIPMKYQQRVEELIEHIELWKKEEKAYSLDDVEEAFQAGVSHNIDFTEPDFEEWMEQRKFRKIYI